MRCGDALFAGTPAETIAFYEAPLNPASNISSPTSSTAMKITLMGKHLVASFELQFLERF